MFCSEMDGIDSLNDVVIILASNRADLIDPAILRPGRIDRKIKVDRPDKEGTREIYRIYLTDNLPYDGVLAKEAEGISASIERLIERFVDWQFTRRDENKFLEVTLRSGRKETLYRSDLISGAIIASIVERAKAIAIKRAIGTQQDQGIRESDRDQTGHRDSTGRRNSGNGPTTRLQRGVRGERHFPGHRHYRGLAQADRLRSGKRREDFTG